MFSKDRQFFSEPLPVVDAEWLREVIALLQQVNGGELDLRSFFKLTLVGHYDVMHEMDTLAGHILFRLSDCVDPAQRETIEVYPFSDGSIHAEDGRHASLEDWRRH